MSEKDCLPHCSKCLKVVTEEIPLLVAACYHVYCSKCVNQQDFLCSYDQTLTSFPDLHPLHVDFSSKDQDLLYETINLNNVPCRLSPCSLGSRCKYNHSASLSHSSYRFCPICSLRIDKETAICPFCLQDKSYYPPSHDPRLKEYMVIDGEEEENSDEIVQIRLEQWSKVKNLMWRLLQWLQVQWGRIGRGEERGEMVFLR